MNALLPRRPVPPLEFPLLGGGAWRLAERRPENFAMVVVYRGLHCPICKRHLGDLQGKLGDFAAKGVEAVAVSSDTQERAEQAKREWGLDKLPLGFGLTIAAGRAWGLYVSASIRDGEPAQFLEPGLFLVRPDGTLYFASVQTMPFARPKWDEVLTAIDFVVAKNYPARGEVAA